jgi:putative adhesin
MRSNRSIGPVCVLVVTLLSITGCIINTGCWGPQIRAERTVEMDHPLAPGSTLVVSTASGSIHLTGQDVDHAHVMATIHARATTEEQAQELADQVEIRFQQQGDKVTIKADRPPQQRRQSISISYQIVVPRQTHVHCSSASGSLNLADLNGNLDAHAASGSIEAAHIQGSVRLSSASGSAHCEDVAGGDVQLSAASGSVRLADASEIGVCDLHAASGSVQARNVDANSLKMRSASGSVTLATAQAQTMDLHSSSGRTKAEDINCARLKAESVSGGVTVTFAPATPGNVNAQMNSGSGSVSVVLPPEFAGQVDLSVGSGSIHTDLPLTVKGKIGKKHISGSIGEGSGHLTARAGSGSIRVK